MDRMDGVKIYCSVLADTVEGKTLADTESEYETLVKLLMAAYEQGRTYNCPEPISVTAPEVYSDEIRAIATISDLGILRDHYLAKGLLDEANWLEDVFRARAHEIRTGTTLLTQRKAAGLADKGDG